MSRERRDLAVMTIVQDEPEFIHPWVNHYKAQVADPRDIFVLVHARESGNSLVSHSDPWSRAERILNTSHGVNVVPVHHLSSFDHRWLVGTVESFFSFLLRSYTWVMFAEADEFVFSTRDRETLLERTSRITSDAPRAIRATGFEVVQQPGERQIPPETYLTGENETLSLSQMMTDRHSWYQSTMYSKILLANAPMNWELGFHNPKGSSAAFADTTSSSDLILAHLHKVDFDLALHRSRRSRAKRWSQVDIELRHGWQNRIDDEASLRAFWQKDVDTEQPFRPGRLQPIPPHVRDLLR